MQIFEMLMQMGWNGLHPVISAIWSKGVLATLITYFVVVWVIQSSRAL